VQHALTSERIDVLVNNAGIGMVGAVEECSIDEARSVFEANFFGALRLIQAFLPRMRSQQSGRIINVSSGVGLMGMPGMPIYSASKQALEGLSEALAGEVAPFGIKVTLVEPGAVLSNFIGSGMLEAQHRLADYASFTGHGRAGLARYYETQAAKPEMVAQAVLAIADDPAPPLRKLVGTDVLQSARAKHEQMRSLIEAVKP
jgi:NAD(P)-dependent dehydrogenase (short-subunit alcohol dehydrogenase family)